MSEFDKRKIRPVEKCGATRKRIFKSHEAGLEFAATFDDAERMRCYKCQYCGCWHLTSQP
jgi:hypothetical protein